MEAAMTLSFRHIVLICLSVCLTGILGQTCLFAPEPQSGELANPPEPPVDESDQQPVPQLNGLPQSDVQRELQPELRDGQFGELVSGNSTFALDLYRAVNDENNNLCYSPYSVSLAMAMAYTGARSNTAQQIKDVLHFDLPDDELHEAFNSLDQLISSRGQGATAADGDPLRLNICNAIWYQQNYPNW